MRFHFGQLIAHLCKTRRLRAGCIIGAGTVSNNGLAQPKATAASPRSARIETMQDGQPMTEFMKFGDTIRIEMKGRDGPERVWRDRAGNRAAEAAAPLASAGAASSSARPSARQRS